MTYKNSLWARQRQKATQRDVYWRKVESEKLDGYGWMMSLDTVRTPEEILLVRQRFERLERQIDRLHPRIGRVLRLRLGINCKAHTLSEIGAQYGVTKDRIRQIEAKGVRIVKRQVWIEEKPEEYLRECEETAKAYAERKRLEREAELAEIKADAAADRARLEDSLRRPGRLREPDGRFVAEAQKRAVLLEEIIREQKRAVALEHEYRGWAGGRERKLLPQWTIYADAIPYAYRLRMRIKRDWLNVATEGFEHGA